MTLHEQVTDILASAVEAQDYGPRRDAACGSRAD